ncbi:hypothetical protein EFE32_13030 [Lactococcus lactis subsp. lactis]|uniref:hypothetical protein n=1 Tax=Lactococcus lactis TaxID=1358 RepID=UPI00223B9340|nr:hypothetical protein [Lactococcus lactis]MCT0017694.1 hypothetical protein [Lactococcus lactis subsp. lactis]
MFKSKKEIKKQKEFEEELSWHYRIQIQRYISDPMLILEEGKDNIVRIRKLPESQDGDYEVIRFNERTNDFSSISYSRIHDIKEIERVFGYKVEFHMDVNIGFEVKQLYASTKLQKCYQPIDAFVPVPIKIIGKNLNQHIESIVLQILLSASIEVKKKDVLVELLQEFYKSWEQETGKNIEVALHFESNDYPTVKDFYKYICEDKLVKLCDFYDELKILIEDWSEAEEGQINASK